MEDTRAEQRVQRPPTNDVFSGIIDDQERISLLSGPTPLIIELLVQAAQTLSPDDKRALLTGAVQLATRGATIPETVSNFVKMVNGEITKNPDPYTLANELSCLSILCGFVRAVERSKNGPDLVQRFIPTLDGLAKKILHDNPDKPDADAALSTFKKKLAQTAGIPLPEPQSPVAGWTRLQDVAKPDS